MKRRPWSPGRFDQQDRDDLTEAIVGTDALPPQQPRLSAEHQAFLDSLLAWIEMMPDLRTALFDALAVEQPLPVDPEHDPDCYGKVGLSSCHCAASVPLPVDPEHTHYEGRDGSRRYCVACDEFYPVAPSVPLPVDPFDNTTEACRHCPTPDVHPTRIGGVLTYEGRCDPETCERHDHSEVASGQGEPLDAATLLLAWTNHMKADHLFDDYEGPTPECAEKVAAEYARLTAPTPAAPLDVERLAAAIPDDALDPYSDWSRDGLARTIHAEYARLTAPKQGEE